MPEPETQPDTKRRMNEMTAKKVIALLTASCACLFLTMTNPVFAKSTTAKEATTSKSTTAKKTSSKKATASKKSTTKKSTTKNKTKKAKKTVKKFSGKVNMNKATAEELMQLPGIGPVKAEKIIKYRKKHGSFKNAEDLMNVEGIGEKTIKTLKNNMRF